MKIIRQDADALDEVFARLSDPDDRPKPARLPTMSFIDVPGWEAFKITIQFAVVNGKPAATGFHVGLLPGVDPEAVTAARLRALPLAVLVAKAFEVTKTGPKAIKGIQRELREAARPTSGKHDPRAFTTPEQVRRVWLAAYDAGLPPRAAVVKQLRIRPRTADRYIRQLREDGLIPDSPRRRAAGQKGK